MAPKKEVPDALYGWWRIIETGTWVDEPLEEGLDIIGPALISFTGEGDQLRMHCLLAYVQVIPVGDVVEFTWQGSWEFDEKRGTGRAWLEEDGRLHGELEIEYGDDSTFVAVKAEPPTEPIPEPPRREDKWGRRRRRRW